MNRFSFTTARADGSAARRTMLLAGVLFLSSGCQRSAVPPAADSTAIPASAATPAEATSASETTADGFGDSSGGATAASDAETAAADFGEAVEIVFEDIQLPIQADMVFRPFMLTDRVRELDGRRVRINGYMLPDSKTKGIRQFVLLKNLQCKFGPGGQADHLVNILMVDGVTAKYRDDAITVEGVLTINPFEGPDGNTWSIYDLACERVATYRPRR